MDSSDKLLNSIINRHVKTLRHLSVPQMFFFKSTAVDVFFIYCCRHKLIPTYRKCISATRGSFLFTARTFDLFSILEQLRNPEPPVQYVTVIYCNIISKETIKFATWKQGPLRCLCPRVCRFINRRCP